MNESNTNVPAWFCVRTQTKREHIAAGYLRELEGIEVFCPRLRYRKATRRGTVWWIEPLFPGYVLAKFNLLESERAVAFCQGVRGLVRFGPDIPSVPEAFVESLRHEIRNHLTPDEEVLTVVPAVECGDEVEVASGPLAGMRGVVVAIAPAAERVKILMDFLGQPHAVDMDLFSILLPRRPIP
jgi:transcriptional antiterminator RfaH